MAALAGPADAHPGLFYLVALNVIAAHDPTFLAGVAAVVVYDVIWFAIPIAALGTFLVRRQPARDSVAALEAWTLRNGRTIILVVSLVAGAYLVIRGLHQLL